MSTEPTTVTEPKVLKSKKVAKALSLASNRPTTSICSMIDKTADHSQSQREDPRKRPMKVHVQVEPSDEDEKEEKSKGRQVAKTCVRVFCLVLNIIPMTMIILGGIYFKQCPLEPMIPLWLIIGGSLYLVYSIFDIYEWATEVPKNARRPVLIVLTSFFIQVTMFVWLICGSVWIYTVFPDRNFEEEDSDYYCNKAVYLTAFSTATAGNAVIGLFFILCFCVGLFAIRNGR